MSGSRSNEGQDGRWCHLKFKSDDGIKVDFDYQILSDGPAESGGSFKVNASPAWLNVTGEHLTGNERVRIVALTYRFGTPHGSIEHPAAPTSEAIDLSWVQNENKFTAQFPSGLF